jgi:O-succinylbenzoate synthase
MIKTRTYMLFRQSFVCPIKTARGVWTDRVSLVLRQDHENGFTSFGEVSALPGFIDFNLKDAQKEAELWSKEGGNIDNFSIIGPAISSLESNIWEGGVKEIKLPSSARLWGTPGCEDARVIKRKIGLSLPQNEIPQIVDWLESLDTPIQVRLDPNESFSKDDLLLWIDALQDYQSVQFIEQPTGPADDEWLFKLAEDSPVPIALDEGLSRIKSFDEFVNLPSELYLVMKPLLFPNWEKTLNLLIDQFERVIFSTAFESPFGYEALLRLCSHSLMTPGLERSCFRGNQYEFMEHHLGTLNSPCVSNHKLVELWDKTFAL